MRIEQLAAIWDTSKSAAGRSVFLIGLAVYDALTAMGVEMPILPVATPPQASRMSKSIQEQIAQLAKSTLGDAYQSLPSISMPVYIPPTPEEREYYASAAILIRRLNKRYKLWRANLPEDLQPVIVALLSNGLTLNVLRITEESHHGIAIEGEAGGVQCMIIMHQSNLQLLCMAEPVTKENPRRTIGFQVSAQSAADPAVAESELQVDDSEPPTAPPSTP